MLDLTSHVLPVCFYGVFVDGKKPRLSNPLQEGEKLDFSNGFILHDDIIGARPGQTFKTNKGYQYRIEYPDLDTYISKVRRKVTPVYGSYANSIVSLFDIHVAPPTSVEDSHEPLEILDAGTGHGSVTLHLARAIQAANPPLPDLELQAPGSSRKSASDGFLERSSSVDEERAQVWHDWRQSRRAVVHSVEISPVYSKHAEHKVVAGFRRGLYSPHIDFYIANVDDWIDGQLGQRKLESFLNYVFLDMPSSHRYLRKVVDAMKENALIAVFVPSITQICDCVQEINANSLPLRMEKTLELGEGISNGRIWNVRLASKRARDPIEESSMIHRRLGDEDKALQEETDTQSEISSTTTPQEEDSSLPLLEAGPEEGGTSKEPVMICRPRVGERLIGGGFVALWRRTAS
ncbi:hypothetical protein EPUS_07235 [Endocarpon pusillum Z07020]|uniref:tRNA (adenine(58)-N(1))-methyltransferase catalytic subunit TRM61 n=1 Tax=Endocarpon pusillum (strain Z07020 / HMAS-L-300199) TaxID=1263415 RepID=U1G9S1_ENDPU|nr:uncharacterized protein EPUS_07235 [Endocarpon pusillum Z07020]ERF68748.1 hypothetical protein EPUS_07235 [Endocarpon pusillum Z07020]